MTIVGSVGGFSHEKARSQTQGLPQQVACVQALTVDQSPERWVYKPMRLLIERSSQCGDDRLTKTRSPVNLTPGTSYWWLE